MKNIILLLFLLNSLIGYNQIPYSWITGNNPLWISSNPTNYTLRWQNCANVVSTSNCSGGSWYSYNNNQNTTYTSLTMNTMCSLSSKIKVDINLDVFLENGYDFLYFEYSTNSGTNWTTIASYTGTQFGTFTYMIPESTTSRFRFRFSSDGTINSYCTSSFFGICLSSVIYYADIHNFSVSCISILPVELSSFNLICDGDFVDINWTTLSETNSKNYILEKSRDLEKWIFVADIIASGNSTTEQHYKYKDDLYGGEFYYRLTQFDLNGDSTTYEPIYNSCLIDRYYLIISPNPNVGDFNIVINSISNLGLTKFDIYDTNGKLMKSRTYNIQSGTTIFNLNLELSDGVYILKTNNENLKTTRFVIKK